MCLLINMIFMSSQLWKHSINKNYSYTYKNNRLQFMWCECNILWIKISEILQLFLIQKRYMKNQWLKVTTIQIQSFYINCITIIAILECTFIFINVKVAIIDNFNFYLSQRYLRFFLNVLLNNNNNKVITHSKYKLTI